LRVDRGGSDGGRFTALIAANERTYKIQNYPSIIWLVKVQSIWLHCYPCGQTTHPPNDNGGKVHRSLGDPAKLEKVRSSLDPVPLPPEIQIRARKNWRDVL
jgi:hypothetical protein